MGLTKFHNTRTGRDEQAAPGTMLHRALSKDDDWETVGGKGSGGGSASADPEGVQSKSELKAIKKPELEDIAREHDVDPEGLNKADLIDAIRAAQVGAAEGTEAETGE